jgi:hypothetical protein
VRQGELSARGQIGGKLLWGRLGLDQPPQEGIAAHGSAYFLLRKRAPSQKNVGIARHQLEIGAAFQVKALPSRRQRVEQGGLPALAHPDEAHAGEHLEIRFQQVLIGSFLCSGIRLMTFSL